MPKVSAPEGHTSAQAGFWPRAWRSAQKEHLRTRGAFDPYSYLGTSKGQASMQ